MHPLDDEDDLLKDSSVSESESTVPVAKRRSHTQFEGDESNSVESTPMILRMSDLLTNMKVKLILISFRNGFMR